MADDRTRIIYYGDNLDILRDHIASESIDLVYLDPPFKSQQDYNLLFRTVRGEPAEAQVRAFTDTWKWTPGVKATCDWLMEDPRVPGKVSEMIRAFHQFLGPSEMLAYLVMMTPRLMELHRVLKPTGSLYLHCDPAASHYLKIVLDSVFGPQNFRNEVVWKRHFAHSSAKRYGPVHDIILFYTRSDEYVWNSIYQLHDDEYVQEFYRYQDEKGVFQPVSLTGAGVRHGDSGQPWRGINPTLVGRHWAIPQGIIERLAGAKKAAQMNTQEKLDLLDAHNYVFWPRKGVVPRFKNYLSEMKGLSIQDVFSDIAPVGAHAKERQGYETQKPLALLKRIIQASSNPGDLVLDPFCGCGTALVAAEELGRSWIGIDITYLAVDVMARRLRSHFPGISFEVRGQPQDEEGAKALKEWDAYQFQFWALSLVGAQSLDPDRKGADRGIDGYIPFKTGAEKYERAVVQVKGGKIGVREVRDLRGTLEREKAPFALLITLEPPTAPMQQEATEAGFYTVPATHERIPRLQIVTVRELLQGQRPRVPSTQVSPVPAAPRIKRTRGQQLSLSDDRSSVTREG